MLGLQSRTVQGAKVMMSRKSFSQSSAAPGIGSMMHLDKTEESAEVREAPSENVPAGAPNVLIVIPDQQNGATISLMFTGCIAAENLLSFGGNLHAGVFDVFNHTSF